MGEEEADGQLRGDLEFVKDQLFTEFENYMSLPNSTKRLKSGDLDALLYGFAEFEELAHRPEPQPEDDGR